ncbi:hypothetical protein VYU27_007079 [Nannochloropsis oceanica]
MTPSRSKQAARGICLFLAGLGTCLALYRGVSGIWTMEIEKRKMQGTSGAGEGEEESLPSVNKVKRA